MANIPRTRALTPARPPADGLARSAIQALAWRLDRLERQVRTLTELVRDHAEDADRLVKIVAEDHEALRRELVREHQAMVRARRRRRGKPR
jgi:hypothetical protein